MAAGHDEPQGGVWSGVGAQPGLGRGGHIGPTVAAGWGRATAKNDTLVKVLWQSEVAAGSDVGGDSGDFADRPDG
jgi:hypothetical protein